MMAFALAAGFAVLALMLLVILLVVARRLHPGDAITPDDEAAFYRWMKKHRLQPKDFTAPQRRWLLLESRQARRQFWPGLICVLLLVPLLLGTCFLFYTGVVEYHRQTAETHTTIYAEDGSQRTFTDDASAARMNLRLAFLVSFALGMIAVCALFVGGNLLFGMLPRRRWLAFLRAGAPGATPPLVQASPEGPSPVLGAEPSETDQESVRSCHLDDSGQSP